MENDYKFKKGDLVTYVGRNFKGLIGKLLSVWHVEQPHPYGTRKEYVVELNEYIPGSELYTIGSHWYVSEDDLFPIKGWDVYEFYKKVYESVSNSVEESIGKTQPIPKSAVVKNGNGNAVEHPNHYQGKIEAWNT